MPQNTIFRSNENIMYSKEKFIALLIRCIVIVYNSVNSTNINECNKNFMNLHFHNFLKTKSKILPMKSVYENPIKSPRDPPTFPMNENTSWM